MVAVAALSIWPRKSAVSRPVQRNRLPVVLLWLLWLFTVWESHASTHGTRGLTIAPNRPVVFLGDSLTAGLSDQAAFPDYMQLSVPIVNMAQAGVTARDMLSRLPAVRDARPQLVIIELGGHDFLRGYPKESTRDSLIQIIDFCREIGAHVVLLEIPRGFIVDPYSGLERELARKFDLELVPDTAIRILVLRSPSSPLGSILPKPFLSDDGLHPNISGAKYLAETFKMTIVKMYGLPVLNSD
jgi:lysophospholipase L1-like esterase